MNKDYAIMLDSVLEFVSDKVGIDKSELTPDTKIEKDVGFAGLDTLIFYDEFFIHFQIENPKDFNANLYVTSDSLEVGLIIKSIFSKKARQLLKTKNCTITHLTNVAMTKKWVDV